MTRRLLSRLLSYRNDSLAVQSAVLIGARWGGFVLSFAIPIVLVRVFSQSEFGIYKQLFLIALTAVPILNLGLTASLFYFVPRDPYDGQRYVLQALAVLSFLGVLAGVALALGAGTISRLMGGPDLLHYLRILALLLVIATPSDLFIVSLPVVDRRPALAGTVSAVSDVVRAAGIILAAVIFRTVEAVLWVAIGVTALRAAWLVVYVRIRTEHTRVRMRMHALSEQLRYSLPFAAAVLFEIALLRFHEYYVASHVTPAEFATYAIGVFQVPLLPILVQSVVEVMLVRTASSAKVRDVHDMQRVWLNVVSFLAIVLLPSWVAAQVWADDLILALFGAAYLPAVPIFRVFLTIIPLMGLIDHGVLRATGDTPYLLKANVAGFVASVITVFALSRFGVFMSAVIGLVVGVLTMRVVGMAKVRTRLALTTSTLLPWNLLIRTLSASAFSALLAVPTFGLAAGLPRLVVGAGIYSAAMTVIIWSGWLIPKDELRQAVARIVNTTGLRSSGATVEVSEMAAESLGGPGEPAPLRASRGDRELLVLSSIDTEEDNWGRAREGVTCENVKILPGHAERLSALGLRTTFFTTHQVAILPWAGEILRELDAGGHEVGTQLHPWNTPPVPEEFVPRLSMTKNLPPELQRQKVHQVTESVAAAIGRSPLAFRTGRWGFGPHVAAALVEHGYVVDSSVLPFIDWNRVDDGPSFVGAPLTPYRLDGQGDVRVPIAGGPLLEIPASAGFNRTPFALWSSVYHQLGSPLLSAVRARGIAVRLGLVRQIMLSPENTSFDDMLSLTDCLLDEGVTYLQLYWHSPSLIPGLTPFAATRSDVDRMLARLERYLEAIAKRFTLRFATVTEAAAVLDNG